MISIEGNVVNSTKERRQRIEIDEISGLIAKVSEPTGSADFVFKDELIFPGFIDLHVHAREDAGHENDYKEDFKTAGEAAINGGVTAFADMPNNSVAPIDDESYEQKLVLSKKCPVPVVLYAGIGPLTKPLKKKVPYKVFMGKSVGDLFFTTLKDLESVVKNYSGERVSFHCEDPEILEKKSGEGAHEAKRPKEAEISAVDFALHLIEKYNISGKICHCSTVEGLNKIIEAKKRGVNVSVETTPHHLFFSAEGGSASGGDVDKLLQVNPPIRQTKENRLGMIAALKRGDIDYLATDHAPHSMEEKKKGISGLTHLDTFGSFVSWLMKEHDFSPFEIARVCSTNPGTFFNQFAGEKHGEIKEGCAGSLSVIDLNKPIEITEDKLKTKNHWSPFLGLTFPGRVVMTVVKGRVYKINYEK